MAAAEHPEMKKRDVKCVMEALATIGYKELKKTVAQVVKYPTARTNFGRACRLPPRLAIHS